MEKDNTDKWLFLKITVKYQELYKTLESQAIGQKKKKILNSEFPSLKRGIISISYE